MHIEYYERDGRIGVKYAVDPGGPEWDQLRKGFHGETELERIKSMDLKPDLGLIPAKIQAQGQEVIARHAHEICRQHLEERIEKAEAFDRERIARMGRTNLPMRVISPNDGVMLHGRIVSAELYYKIVVVLEQPFSCRTTPYANPTCWAASMVGHRTYDLDTGELTPWAIEDAKQKLVQIYEYEKRRRKHGDVLQVVEELNDSIA